MSNSFVANGNRMMVLSMIAAAISSVSCANMNGKYLIANLPSSSSSSSVSFEDDYSAKGYEYFDIYSPEIATHYSEVFWHDQLNQALPQSIIDRFINKTIAIVGYEHDQVMVQPVGQPGLNQDKDVSVPINWAYNHHYGAFITGAASEMVRIQENEENSLSSYLSHHHARFQPREIVGVDHPADIPSSSWFSEGNGGESRKSYHGYPRGYAQLIFSPTQFHVIPMQIDTRNRDCGVTPDDIFHCTHFVTGPEPKQARYGRSVSVANVSGLVECPCNSRFGGDNSIFYPNAKTKTVQHSFYVKGSSSCGVSDTISDADSCFKSIDALNIYSINSSSTIQKSINDPSYPSGCTIDTSSSTQTPVIYYNSYIESPSSCTDGVIRSGSTATEVNTKIEVKLDRTNSIVDIILTGPSDVWFGVGFNAQKMADSPWALIVEATDGDAIVSERKIGTCGDEGKHCPGTLLNSSFTIISQSTIEVDGVILRTVSLRRTLNGPSSDYYNFTSDASSIPLISAVGSQRTISYHRAHTSTVIALTTVGINCICDHGAQGALCDTNGENCSAFTKNCIPEPYGDLEQQQNPTCNSRQYGGGLSCCGDGRLMLDADQAIPEALLRYHMKFRFWFQEYTESPTPSHFDLQRIYQQTEHDAGEYDVPPAFQLADMPPIVGYPDWPINTPTPGTTCTGTCPSGDDCDCVHTIHFSWSWDTDVRLLYAGGHCHAPSCRSLELYTNSTESGLKLICRQIPVFGSGDVLNDKFDEADFIQIPPCLWGDEQEGLEPSFLIPAHTQMLSIKKNTNTHAGHFGEMASWQMRGTFF